MPKPALLYNADGMAVQPTFNIKKFYAGVIKIDEDEMGANDLLMGIDGAQSRIFELMRRIRQKEFRKRAQGKCLFSLNPNSQIALSFYSTILPTKKPTPKKVNAENNEQLRSTQRFICETTGKTLYKQDIGTYYPLGNEKVKITPEEVLKVKRFGKLGMNLMGFKPKSYLKVYHNTKHSTFVYPDENTIKGSSQCTDALIHEMHRKEKIAIVRVQVRDNAQVRFCALLPSLPKEGDDVTQAGF
jgi:ATP-dependent DNA helicase 2 subunit 1